MFYSVFELVRVILLEHCIFQGTLWLGHFFGPFWFFLVRSVSKVIVTVHCSGSTFWGLENNSFGANGRNLFLKGSKFCDCDCRYMAIFWKLCVRSCHSVKKKDEHWCFVLFHHFPGIISQEIEFPLIDWAVDGTWWEEDILSWNWIREKFFHWSQMLPISQSTIQVTEPQCFW